MNAKVIVMVLALAVASCHGKSVQSRGINLLDDLGLLQGGLPLNLNPTINDVTNLLIRGLLGVNTNQLLNLESTLMNTVSTVCKTVRRVMREEVYILQVIPSLGTAEVDLNKRSFLSGLDVSGDLDQGDVSVDIDQLDRIIAQVAPGINAICPIARQFKQMDLDADVNFA